MDPGQYKPGAPKSSFIPALCEVCRNRPVAMIVVDFIFACNQCAKRIEAAIWHRRDERLLATHSRSSSSCSGLALQWRRHASCQGNCGLCHLP